MGSASCNRVISLAVFPAAGKPSSLSFFFNWATVYSNSDFADSISHGHHFSLCSARLLVYTWGTSSCTIKLTVSLDPGYAVRKGIWFSPSFGKFDVNCGNIRHPNPLGCLLEFQSCYEPCSHTSPHFPNPLARSISHRIWRCHQRVGQEYRQPFEPWRRNATPRTLTLEYKGSSFLWLTNLLAEWRLTTTFCVVCNKTCNGINVH